MIFSPPASLNTADGKKFRRKSGKIRERPSLDVLTRFRDFRRVKVT